MCLIFITPFITNVWTCFTLASLMRNAGLKTEMKQREVIIETPEDLFCLIQDCDMKKEARRETMLL